MGRAQHLAANRAHLMHNLLGIPVVVLSAVVGTTIFSSLGSQPDKRLVVAAGFVSMLAAVLAALQTFLEFAEQSKRHLAAAISFNKLKRDLDMTAVYLRSTNPEPEVGLAHLRPFIDRYSTSAEESPAVNDSLYDRARREQERDDEGI
jgi:hypothetical protein